MFDVTGTDDGQTAMFKAVMVQLVKLNQTMTALLHVISSQEAPNAQSEKERR